MNKQMSTSRAKFPIARYLRLHMMVIVCAYVRIHVMVVDMLRQAKRLHIGGESVKVWSKVLFLI